MAEIVGRAGFHAQHTKNASERGAIVHEMMRELDEESIAYWVKRNPNIVVDDEPLNEAMVNDGDGGFRVCTDRQEVLDYGAKRIRRVKRKFREDKPDPKTGKMKGGTVTTTLIVAHLPKSMCVEVPGYYPVLDSKTKEPALDADGASLMRSRWVARDRDDARCYFQDVVHYLAENVVPGGANAVLGYDIQHSESTPHVQILADTFAEDPKSEDGLRVEASQAWFSHRDVKNEDGRQKSGPAKMRGYHAGLKRHLIDLGYDISPDFDEERHLVGMGKDEYGRTMDAKRHIDVLRERAVEDHEKLNAWDADLRERRDDLDDEADELHKLRQEIEARSAALDERSGTIERIEADLPRQRRKALSEGREEGRRLVEQAEAAHRAAEKSLLAERRRLMAKPALFEEFLDRTDSKGRSYRPFFERFVDKRLTQFEAERRVSGDLVLEPGDREQFIRDGGKRLAEEVTQLQRQREYGE